MARDLAMELSSSNIVAAKRLSTNPQLANVDVAITVDKAGGITQVFIPDYSGQISKLPQPENGSVRVRVSGLEYAAASDVLELRELVASKMGKKNSSLAEKILSSVSAEREQAIRAQKGMDLVSPWPPLDVVFPKLKKRK